MAEFRMTDMDTIVRVSDGATIPNDPANRDRAEFDAWIAAGGVPEPYIVPAPEPAAFLSQDLMAQFTADDAAKIKAAVETNPQFWLLWSAMQAQKDPMQISNARFLAGWSALVFVLGASRMSAIAGALGVSIVV